MILLIGLNIFKGTEPEISYTIGSLAQHLHDNNIPFKISDLDLSKSEEGYELDYIISHLENYDLKQFDFVGISVFTWAEFIINDLINYIKSKNTNIKVILGGPQITYSTNFQLQFFYPNADFFIKGYGEEALVDLIQSKSTNRTLYKIPDADKINSPYANIIQVAPNQPMIRIETKRGCPYNCAFCAHFDKKMKHKILEFTLDRIVKDLSLIKDKKVKKVNVLDPIFNIGKNYKAILRLINEMNIRSLFSFQARFELIDDETIELCKAINCNLEFGLQTIIPEEEKIIDRRNNKQKIKQIMHKLNEAQVSYEISIIYGFPGQTYESFLKTVDFIVENGGRKIMMFPLAILRGTKLDLMQEFYQIKTVKFNRFDAPIVVSSYSFDFKGWEKMHLFAQNYKTTELCKKSLL